MRKLVIDASVWLKLVGGRDEVGIDALEELIQRAEKTEWILLAPEFILVESVNILMLKKRLDLKMVGKFIDRTMDRLQLMRVYSADVMAMASLIEHKGLTAYDGLYLWLAEDNDCKLVTEDGRLLEQKEAVALKKAVNMIE